MDLFWSDMRETMNNIPSFFVFYILMGIFLLAPCEGLFAEKRKSPMGGGITITSKTLTADNKAKIAFFEGDVKAVKGETTLYADKMTVYYQDERPAGSIEKIECEGNIKLIMSDRVITSSSAQYFSGDDEKVVFTGEPRATDGNSIITGTKMTYFLKSGSYVVEKSKVLLKDIENRGEKKVGR